MDHGVLGLDLGPNSIGWALVEESEAGRPLALTACGVRIFQQATEAKTGTPKNHARRAARMLRRQTARRRRRREKLSNLLVRHGLLPADADERQALLSDLKTYDPYPLRARALDEALTPHELGRVCYHLNQRRGFLSNRKAAKEDDGKVRTTISTLAQAMQTAGSRTLGEHLAAQPKKRGIYTDRAMYQQEFAAVWEAQQPHHPDLLTPALKVELHNTLFHQRPLKVAIGVIGRCVFEPRHQRAQRGLPEAQRARLLQDLNNLHIQNPHTLEFAPLRPEQRAKLLSKLNKQKSLTWDAARKTLDLHAGEVFNLERGRKSGLPGSATVYDLRKRLKKTWDDLPPARQSALVIELLKPHPEADLLQRLQDTWGFAPDIAGDLAQWEAEPGYAQLSLKVLRRILPYLEQGMRYDEACAAAGYHHSLQTAPEAVARLPMPPALRNPVVQKALYEVRKTVNAVVRRYGKPRLIRVEMARDMKQSAREKAETDKRQRQLQRANDQAAAVLRDECGIARPSREDVLKYRLWQECRMACPYTGTPISREMLFAGEVDIEHILPYSLSLDDSFMNKTLCLAAENRQHKKNRSPYEAYSGNPEKYQAILQRVRHLPWPKRRRFEQKEIKTDDFIARQLNDTRYIARAVKEYLQHLGCAVDVSKGEATAVLRKRWGLNAVLGLSGEKNRADHRHHAVDAVVVALTSKALFQKLSRLSAQYGGSLMQRGFELDEPWPGFGREVRARVGEIVVSHVPMRRISGALHEETAYGYSTAEQVFVYRKPVESLTAKTLADVRDPKVRALLEARLAEAGGEVKKAFANPDHPVLHADGKTPIRSVRIVTRFNQATTHAIRDNDGRAYKHFRYGNNHHVEILQHRETGKRKGVFVTALEAAARARRRKEPIVQRDHGPDWQFVMSLTVNDMVVVEERYYRVQLLDASNEKVVLRLHTAATLEDNSERLIKTPNTLRCRKISVDPVGEVSECHD